MAADDLWGEQAKRLLWAEIVWQVVTYQDLTKRLAEMDVTEAPENIRNNVSRGKFMAGFLRERLRAIGVETLGLENA